MDNDLTLMSDAALDQRLLKIEERRGRMRTPEGQALLHKKMLEIIGVLANLGYKVPGDAELIARVWGDQLKEYAARIGYNGIRRAVMNWIDKDTSKYMIFPKVGWIIEECKLIGGDPIIEKGRREHAKAIAKLEQEHREEVERFKRDYPEQWKKIQEKVRKYEQRAVDRSPDGRPRSEIYEPDTDGGDKFYISRR